MAAGTGEKYAFLVGGTHSGCGKTTIALGLLAALKARGLGVQPFKVGPDFIDPGLHTVVAGRQSRNLDGWMLGRQYSTELFLRFLEASEVGLLEGVMGIYDGYDGRTESGSSAEMAKWLGIPAVLVVDARSMARSAAALIYGFVRFDPALDFAGVIFNQVGGEAHLRYLKEAVASACPEIAVLGGIPKEDRVVMPERHLGLVTADEMRLDAGWQKRLAELLEKHVDIDLLLEKTAVSPQPASPLLSARGDSASAQPVCGDTPPPLIAIARDAAFCFYYPDNLELLEKAGARLHFFSPVSGEALPEECSGVYLGGGYPELFAGAISGNADFIQSLRERAGQGMPIYAECGGLMTLGRFIETIEGEKIQMAGILPFGTRMLPRRKALGYTEVVLRRQCLLGSPGMVIRGHEFHYSEIVEPEPHSDTGPASSPLEFAYELRRRKHEAARPEGYQSGSVLASYIHLHWGSAPEAAEQFVRHCALWTLTAIRN
ncbi:cobyrinate a,c-diamide synthase [Syntrophobacter sp. SbD1]|nr:cobyrinate a,c-diamide synthase [Syntrophobacter sp. SbD1]